MTLAEELRRRLLHMDWLHTDTEKMEVIKDYLQKLVDSGYDHKTRIEFTRSAVRKF